MAAEHLAEAARKRAEAAEKAELKRFKRLTPILKRSGAVIPGEDFRVVTYINRQLRLDGREEADRVMLRRRRAEILDAAERREQA